jgi:hypothetical protein
VKVLRRLEVNGDRSQATGEREGERSIEIQREQRTSPSRKEDLLQARTDRASSHRQMATAKPSLHV